ncbi:MAG: type I restriction enzyme HsdR N-terminal domain-containing protein [Devosia sp.]|uniref:type I restriction enzyme HsdR N-terminal domain-containing protein n=1 Tax=Devosia sp. TaxID=1871048 RepID=UPI001A457144|nr:type I restriction enzyme HsdR N-terminal domain-containing protein [Devosia sp.]MBL8600095.1 type I restriction enzyme HsdR N-terminal domain-containing protein [Devosia sp.]
MTFREDVADLAKRAISAQAVAQTEEATKNAIVMPFLRVLGFDVFDPAQIIPEYVADVGLKKGEKIDYAAKIGDRIEYLVEAKSVSTNLRDAQYSQLFRYFHTSDANIGILTNGLHIWFFTDLDAPNKMDQTPFFKFNLLDYDDNDLHELEKFHKDKFSIENIKAAASTLKYLRGAMSFIEAQWTSPDEEFVRMVARGIYEGKLTTTVVDTFKPIVRRAFDDLFRQRAKARLDVAFDGDAESALEAVDEDKIDTTPDELQGFMIVRAIAAEVAPVSRVVMRDAQSYCAVLFDDNNRKPIIRLHFSGKQKFITTFEAGKEGVRHDLAGIEEIFAHKERVTTVVRSYLA